MDDGRRTTERGGDGRHYIYTSRGERERERERERVEERSGRTDDDGGETHPLTPHSLTQEQPQRWRYEGERFHGQSNLRRPPTPVIDDDGIVHPPIKIHIPPHESIPRAYRHRDAHRQLRLSRYRAICAAREERAKIVEEMHRVRSMARPVGVIVHVVVASLLAVCFAGSSSSFEGGGEGG